MGWTPISDGVAADGSAAFTVERWETAVPLRLATFFVRRKIWRVRVWAANAKEPTAESTVRAVKDVQDLLAKFDLTWKPPDEHRAVPGLN